MAVIIRTARLADAAEIARLTAQLGYEADPASIDARLSRLLAREEQLFLVAASDGHVVGWIHALIGDYIESDPFVVIGGLVVDRNARRLGVGRLLMLQAEDWARSRGHSVIRLSSSATRTAAHRFYEALGYTRIKIHFAFAKSLDGQGDAGLRRFVPRVDE